MHQGEAIHGPGQLLPLVCGGLRRASCAADGAGLPNGTVRMDAGGAGELQRAEESPLSNYDIPTDPSFSDYTIASLKSQNSLITSVNYAASAQRPKWRLGPTP